ncbi:MAG: FAD-dependent oxidoreductase, partial [Chloroflexi bacterium]|nr:FAD-dependent oxidoreductase [Chloroflexota bacterium]
MSVTGVPRAVVLGGGFSGLEAAFLLRQRLGDKVDLTLISDQEEFIFKPNTIYIPFGLDPRSLTIPLAPPLKRKKIQFVQAHAHEVDPVAKRVEADHAAYPYDYLIVATGATMRPEEIPGLGTYA